MSTPTPWDNATVTKSWLTHKIWTDPWDHVDDEESGSIPISDLPPHKTHSNHNNLIYPITAFSFRLIPCANTNPKTHTLCPELPPPPH